MPKTVCKIPDITEPGMTTLFSNSNTVSFNFSKSTPTMQNVSTRNTKFKDVFSQASKLLATKMKHGERITGAEVSVTRSVERKRRQSHEEPASQFWQQMEEYFREVTPEDLDLFIHRIDPSLMNSGHNFLLHTSSIVNSGKMRFLNTEDKTDNPTMNFESTISSHGSQDMEDKASTRIRTKRKGTRDENHDQHASPARIRRNLKYEMDSSLLSGSVEEQMKQLRQASCVGLFEKLPQDELEEEILASQASLIDCSKRTQYQCEQLVLKVIASFLGENRGVQTRTRNVFLANQFFLSVKEAKKQERKEQRNREVQTPSVEASLRFNLSRRDKLRDEVPNHEEKALSITSSASDFTSNRSRDVTLCDSQSMRRENEETTSIQDWTKSVKLVKLDDRKLLGQIRGDLERVRTLCDRVIRRERIKRDRLNCMIDLYAKQLSLLPHSVINSISSSTTSVETLAAEKKSDTNQGAESYSCSFNSSRQVDSPSGESVYQTILSSCDGTPQSNNSEMEQRTHITSNAASGCVNTLIYKKQNKVESLPTEVVMTAVEACIQNQRLPSGYAWVPISVLGKGRVKRCQSPVANTRK